MGSKAGKILGAILPIAAPFILGPAGFGLTGAALAGGSAAAGAAGGLLSGGGLKGALIGGATGALGGGVGDKIAAGAGLSGAGASALSHGLTGAVAGLGNGGDLKSAALGGLAGGAGGYFSGGGSLSDLLGGGGSQMSAGGIPIPSVKPPVPGAIAGASSAGGSTLGGGGAGGSSLFGGNSLSNILGGGMNMYAQDTAEDQLLKSQRNTLDALNPFLQTGADATGRLAGSLDELTTPFTPGDLQNEPGYQFNLNQGQNQLNNTLAAGGMLGSGAAIKAGQQFSQGLADTTYQNAFNRDLLTKQNKVNTLNTAAAPGLAAAGAVGDVNNNIGKTQSQATAAKANTLTSTLSGLLSGSGAKQIIGYKSDGTPIYA